MNMDEKKRVKHWGKIFSNTEDGSSIAKPEKRLQVRANRIYTSFNF